MVEALLVRAGFTDLFDARISTDAARTFKPDPRAYGLGRVERCKRFGAIAGRDRILDLADKVAQP